MYLNSSRNLMHLTYGTVPKFYPYKYRLIGTSHGERNTCLYLMVKCLIKERKFIQYREE